MKNFILIFLFSVSYCSYAQDPIFSQIQNTRIYSNPSAVDFSKLVQFSIIHRRQWTNIPDNGYKSYFADVCWQPSRISIGFSYLNDVEGTGKLTTQDYRIKFIRTIIIADVFSLSGGFWGGPMFKSINYDNLVFSDQLNLESGITASTYEYEDRKQTAINAGVGFTLKLKRGYHNTGGQPKIYHVLSASGTHLGGKEATVASNDKIKIPELIILDYSPTIITYAGNKNDVLFNPYLNLIKQGKFYKTTIGFLNGVANNKDNNRSRVSSFYWGLSLSNQINPFSKKNINAFVGTIGYEKNMSDWLFTTGLSYDINYGAFDAYETFPVIELTLIISKASYNSELVSNIFNRSGQICPRYPGATGPPVF